MESVWKKSEILHAEPSQKTESNRTDNEEEEDEVVRIWTWGRGEVGRWGSGKKFLPPKVKEIILAKDEVRSELLAKNEHRSPPLSYPIPTIPALTDLTQPPRTQHHPSPLTL